MLGLHQRPTTTWRTARTTSGCARRAAAPPRAFASSGTALHCSRPHGRRRQRFWFRRSARLRRCGGRGDLVGQDDDAAAGDAGADAACADARLAMLPRPHPPTVASEAVGAPTGRIGPARPPTHDARSVGAVKAYPSSVSVTVVRAVRSLADSTLLSYDMLP